MVQIKKDSNRLEVPAERPSKWLCSVISKNSFFPNLHQNLLFFVPVMLFFLPGLRKKGKKLKITTANKVMRQTHLRTFRENLSTRNRLGFKPGTIFFPLKIVLPAWQAICFVSFHVQTQYGLCRI